MSSSSISINNQNVKQFLETGKEKHFIIPEFQRPYAWEFEQVQTLFDDLRDFASSVHDEPKKRYFLGSIVAYDNGRDEQEIIDGQQRITTLLLLLRALYSKLQTSEETSAQNLAREIAPCIWEVDDISGEIDYDKMLIESRVINNDGNQLLSSILKNGTADHKAKDNYSKNYNLLVKLLDQFSQEDPMMIYKFTNSILRQTIVLPITADSQDTALTIFQTLNNRGLPLSDADIFKAKIYGGLSDQSKKQFIENWQQLESDIQDVDGESMQKLFNYYSYFVRAIHHEVNTSTKGVRDYFTKTHPDELNENILPKLAKIATLIEVIFGVAEPDSEPWASNIEIRQILDCLSSYPNEFWKYPVIVYYLQNHDKKSFERDFLLFLRKLCVELLASYINYPSVVGVKSGILNLDADIIEYGSAPKFALKNSGRDGIEEKLYAPHSRMVKMILKLLAYSEQDKMLPSHWEIEHIFPQKWQNNYFINDNEADIKAKIEHIGNKLPFEKRLNILAGNGYFAKKKIEYAKSNIQIVKDISIRSSDDWSMDDIVRRDKEVADKIINIINLWEQEYENARTEQSPHFTDEQLAQAKKILEQQGEI